MDLILVKIFATAFTLSEILTHPASVKTHLDPIADQDEVVQVLRDGCSHIRRAFDIETINLDELIATALENSSAFSANAKAFHGINFADLDAAYHRFCKNEGVDQPLDLAQVIEFYNAAAADLPDPSVLKLRKLPSMSTVLDGGGHGFADIFEPRNRRIWVPLAEIPEQLRQAAIAAEDRRFFDHHGVDERGIIRAFLGNLGASGRPQGGSSITQQVVKNLLVGEDVSYERKIREMIVASRLEAALSKDEILELYLNSAYLGRGSWGVEMAARSYFAKSARALTLSEAAMLAGLLKGPSYFDPERHPDRAKERLAYVLGRMAEDGVIDAQQKEHALAEPPKAAAFARPRRDSGFQFVDFLAREARSDGVGSLTAEFIYCALDDPCAAATGHRSGTAGRLGAIRDVGRTCCMARPRGEHRRRGPQARSRRRRVRAGMASRPESGALAALRRPLDARRHLAKSSLDPHRARGRTHRASRRLEWRNSAQPQSL